MIGVIADDFTGGTDVAAAFRRGGLRTVLYFGIPGPDIRIPPADAVVISLKTRTAPVGDAVAESLRSGRWLHDHGARQLFFKYCSTFDSTPAGNIGAVADALADLTASTVTVVVPSSPDRRRTQYMGQLFVAGQPLAESPMRHHPLTPMTDSSVPRLLRAQTDRPVDLIDLHEVRCGAEHLRKTLDASGRRSTYAVIDAIDDADLLEIGRACLDAPLVTGAAGLAAGLGVALRERRAGHDGAVVSGALVSGPAVALAGSCSARTLEQVAEMRRTNPTFHLIADRTSRPSDLAAEALRWYDALRHRTPAPLIYSSLPPQELRAVQADLGVDEASLLLETALGEIAVGLRTRGVRRFVIAGGETSGAVVTALGVEGGIVGAELAPGVPWIHTLGNDAVSLLLKSGNFGESSLLVEATAAQYHSRTVTVA